MQTLILHAAALRGRGDCAGAIELVEDHEANQRFADDFRVPAYLQCFYAAVEGGLTSKANEYARKIAGLDAGVPSVQAYLVIQERRATTSKPEEQ